MAEVTILTEKELKDCVTLDRSAVDIIERAFVELASGKVVMPPILRLDMEDRNGEVDVKTAYVPGLSHFAIKTSPGFFDNPKRGLPTTNGLMVLHSCETGMVEAVLLDNGYLTDVRTAAAGGVAARHLARKDAKVAGVVGAGTQARLQMQALKLERDIETVYVWARRGDAAAECAADIARTLGVEAKAREDLAAMVADCDVVVTTTPSREPLITADMLHPGLHVTAMGSDAEHKNEIAPAALAAVDVFVADTRSQSERLGELHHAMATGTVGTGFDVIELGALVSGARKGRISDDQVTLCDLTGTGVQDTAIATHAFGVATQKGMGSRILN